MKEAEKNPPKRGFRQDASKLSQWTKVKNGIRSGCRYLRANQTSPLFRGTKFVMQLSGTATFVTPQMVDGVNKLSIGETQTELAGVQRYLGTLKGEMQNKMTFAQSFGILNKKEADVEKDIFSQVAAEITLAGNFFSTLSKVDIGG